MRNHGHRRLADIASTFQTQVHCISRPIAHVYQLNQTVSKNKRLRN